MEKKTIREAYADFFKALSLNSVAAAKIDSSNVYQLANPKNRKLMDKLVEDNLLPESHLENVENFLDFYNQVKSGKSGLILMEHYSNTDLPALLYMLEHSGNSDLADLSKRTVAIAGMKLNEDNPIVRAFAESFTRVVIYPTRSLTKNEEKAQSEEEAKEEMLKARKINLAAMRAMDDCKKRGEVILVFPSGCKMVTMQNTQLKGYKLKIYKSLVYKYHATEIAHYLKSDRKAAKKIREVVENGKMVSGYYMMAPLSNGDNRFILFSNPSKSKGTVIYIEGNLSPEDIMQLCYSRR